jgi:hypothetical protein
MFSKSFRGAALMGVIVTTVLVGCGDDGLPGTGALCCTDFKVGADLSGVDFGVDASIKGQFSAFAQASGDLSGAAQGALLDVAGACKGIATVGGANADAAEPADPAANVKFWCDLAIAQIDAAFSAQGGASAALKVTVKPAECKASFKAEANCQVNCQVDASCDAKATPPTCEGGEAKLEISCEGSCTGSAEAPSISCEGSCEGTCEGACTASGGASVECDGKCEGNCTASGGGNNSGLQADGTCKGQCSGTCTARADVKASCSGSCKGSCTGTCKATPGSATVKCDGKCSNEASVKPISCKGGELKAKCEVDANCGGNCKASASAKAECTPPSVDIVFNASASGTASGQASLMIEALRVNLPQILLVFQARGQAFVELTGKVVASGSATLNPGKLGVKGTACLAAIVPVVVQAGANVKAAVEASGSVAGKFTL